MFPAAILGVIQGLTEFLPISSSAHLILVPWLLGWKAEGLVFDVSLHVGTALAILAYFWKDWLRLAKELIGGLVSGEPFKNSDCRLAWFILVGTIPAAVAGLVLEKRAETALRSPIVTVVTLAVLGIILYISELRGRRRRSLEDLAWADSIWIGMSQVLALIPGVSRSGVTISTALLRDVDRAPAARFSFLLATPVIAGAGVLEGWRFIKAAGVGGTAAAGTIGTEANPGWAILAVGTACAAITGFLCIRYFLRYLQKNTYIPFVIYRIVLAGVVLFFYLRLSVGNAPH